MSDDISIPVPHPFPTTEAYREHLHRTASTIPPIAGVRLRNLTDQHVAVYPRRAETDQDMPMISVPTCGTVARVRRIYEPALPTQHQEQQQICLALKAAGIPTVAEVAGDVVFDLPPPEFGVVYLVTREVMVALDGDRVDCMAADPAPDLPQHPGRINARRLIAEVLS